MIYARFANFQVANVDFLYIGISMRITILVIEDHLCINKQYFLITMPVIGDVYYQDSARR